MLILIPYFGELARFRPLLDIWFEAYRRLPLPAHEIPVTLVSDDPKAEAAAEDHECRFLLVKPIEGVERHGVAFDRKGAIVCAAIQRIPVPCFVLDSDAFLVRDPRATLGVYKDVPLAMPLDHGAILHFRTVFMDAPYSNVPKMCAGVQFFGDPSKRAALVDGYRKAWAELIALPVLPWTPPISNLVEQYAWSLVASRMGGRSLPATMNWAPHHVGANPDAIVNHYFDYNKWRPGVLPAVA